MESKIVIEFVMHSQLFNRVYFYGSFSYTLIRCSKRLACVCVCVCVLEAKPVTIIVITRLLTMVTIVATNVRDASTVSHLALSLQSTPIVMQSPWYIRWCETAVNTRCTHSVYNRRSCSAIHYYTTSCTVSTPVIFILRKWHKFQEIWTAITTDSFNGWTPSN